MAASICLVEVRIFNYVFKVAMEEPSTTLKRRDAMMRLVQLHTVDQITPSVLVSQQVSTIDWVFYIKFTRQDCKNAC